MIDLRIVNFLYVLLFGEVKKTLCADEPLLGERGRIAWRKREIKALNKNTKKMWKDGKVFVDIALSLIL